VKLTPHDTYKSYLALKQHFTKDTYDFHRYHGHIKASEATFYKRKDRYFFEKLSRQKNDNEIIDFFVSNFVSSDDPQSLWVGDIIKSGGDTYFDWKKRIESLSYVFEQELKSLTETEHLLKLIEVSKGRHPRLLKEYLRKNVSIETLVILDLILNYRKKFDAVLDDPIWKIVSKKMSNYSGFLSIDVDKYKEILRRVVI